MQRAACGVCAGLLHSVVAAVLAGQMGRDRPLCQRQMGRDRPCVSVKPSSSWLLGVPHAGLAMNTAYQALHTVPRWDSLVAAHMRLNSVSTLHAVASLAAFGAVFNVHSYAQVRAAAVTPVVIGALVIWGC
jgi:hypothetical protein